MDEEEIRCSFCDKTEDDVERMISGPNDIYICNECVQVCNDIIREIQLDSEEFHPTERIQDFELMTPAEIKAKLDDYIVGQEEAKRALSVAVYNHYKRIQYSASAGDDDVVLEKSNILMIGPTGSGKTLLAKTLAGILNVPFAVADATTLTEAGYVGEDVENILLKLIQAADFDIRRAEMGIIYIDEIDKITRKSENVSITRDVSGEGVQQALLKIIESTVASVPPQGGRKHPQQECLQIDTTNILFICGGAFVGLEKIVTGRKDNSKLGFGGQLANKEQGNFSNIVKELQPDDLVKYGLIPEFVGRVPVVVGLNALDEGALVKILKEPKNALVKQYKKMFKIDGVDIEFDDDALIAVAEKAIKLHTGARGLKSILEALMTDLMFDIPSDKTIKKVVIKKEVITKGKKPVIVRDKSA